MRQFNRPFIGMKCQVTSRQGDNVVWLDFRIPRNASFKLDMVGKDFVRMSHPRRKVYYPFTSIKGISMR